MFARQATAVAVENFQWKREKRSPRLCKMFGRVKRGYVLSTLWIGSLGPFLRSRPERERSSWPCVHMGLQYNK